MSTRTARRRPAPAARRRPSRGPSRRTVLRRRLVAILVLVGVTAFVVTVWFTPALGVREVEVAGVVDLTEAQVREVAAIDEGTPLVQLDTRAVADRVHRLPRVAGVTVERVLPSTVRLTVDEREPVAVVKAADGAHLVDATGRDYAVVASPPDGVPELTAQPNAVAAAVSVLTAVPESLRREVSLVRAGSPADIRLTLSEGREVRWGSPEDTPRKAAVLDVLLTRNGTVFDVSSPELPTVSDGPE
ncbi:cell division protein FtsQ/DivIB [Saccharothrix longispora]|uniref:cell division protein FtsQ/DivIB n=1 Tax=Saccharothrix longispora TaxID=33920 RepID=UPI0028FD262E|nr:FtsQ-type POTRA domain-containing protein [Saccharothrix longispora]MDU0294528.1 FtsQ-type POTRA domain-containing protein [Saccharothrix longispora]